MSIVAAEDMGGGAARLLLASLLLLPPVAVVLVLGARMGRYSSEAAIASPVPRACGRCRRRPVDVEPTEPPGAGS